MKLTLYTDGGCRPTNPGDAGFACVLVNEYGHEKHVARYIGRATNNIAEYKAVIVGVKMASEEQGDYLEIVCDSQLVINQVLGKWQCKDSDLKVLRAEAQDLLSRHFGDNWHFTHVRGHGKDLKSLSPKKKSSAELHAELNEMCDQLCSQAIDEARQLRRERNPWLQRLSRRAPRQEDKVRPAPSSPRVTASSKRQLGRAAR